MSQDKQNNLQKTFYNHGAKKRNDEPTMDIGMSL